MATITEQLERKLLDDIGLLEKPNIGKEHKATHFRATSDVFHGGPYVKIEIGPSESLEYVKVSTGYTPKDVGYGSIEELSAAVEQFLRGRGLIQV